MNRANSRLALLTTLALLLATTGCPRSQSQTPSLSKSSMTSVNAMADLQAGRVDNAIEGFEKVTLDEPRNYAAHFQLAVLLQDVKKDYVGAIGHFRAYLKLRPKSEKSGMAEERIKLCERLYTAAMTDDANIKAAFEAEKAKIAKSRDAALAKVSKLEADLAAARREMAALRQRNDAQHRMIAKLGDGDEGAATPPTKPRDKLRPSDADLLDEPDENNEDRFSASSEAKKLRALLDAEDAADRKERAAFPKPPKLDDDEDAAPPSGRTASKPSDDDKDKTSGGALDSLFGGKKKAKGPSRPETYVVEEGDTLMGISARFYGTNTKWRKIRDANRGVISPDGRVKIGQEIKLP